MREIKIVDEILEELRKISAEKEARVSRAKLLIGELNQPKEVRKWLEKTEEKEFDETKFEIETAPAEISCECGYSGKIESAANFSGIDKELEIECPRCRSQELELTGGLEKKIVNIEWEA